MKVDEVERHECSSQKEKRSLPEALRNAIPFLVFYALLISAAVLTSQQFQTPIGGSTLRLDASGDVITVQQKDPRNNHVRHIQLQHTLKNAAAHRKALEAARKMARVYPTEENQQNVTFWKKQCHDDHDAYTILVAETDDSLFAQTHLPRELP